MIQTHMKQIKDAGIGKLNSRLKTRNQFFFVGVLVVSWYPPGDSDGSAFPPDTLFPKLLDEAVKHGLKIAPHIEPYKDRDPFNFVQNINYFNGK